jgi:epoxyqueuosine reductase
MPADLNATLRSRASELGFALVGVARPDASSHAAFYRRWLAAGRHGEMRYLARPDAVARREDPKRTLATIRSVVVVADDYYCEEDPSRAGDPSRAVVARYARGRDYHKVLERKLRLLLDALRDAAGTPVHGRAYVDTGPLLERELAARAGLGWFGKNTMLINPKRGSWFFLGCLLLDLDLEPDEPFAGDHCGTCRRCLDACPTGALRGRDERGAPVMDARRCISYLTIEQRGPIPDELRTLIGNRIYGCDICQEVCPFNQKFARPTDEPAYAARGPGEPPRGVQPLPPDVMHPGTDGPPLVELMRMDEAAWESFSRGSAVRRAGRAGFLRNVAVALGNWGSAEAVPALACALDDEEPLVRGHAAWALGRIGGQEAQLAGRLAAEPDEWVRGELRRALEAGRNALP